MLVASYITNILLNTLIISVCYFLYLQRQARMTTCCFMQSLHCVMLLYGIGRHLVFHRLKPSVCTWWILLLKGLGKTDETHFLFHHLIIIDVALMVDDFYTKHIPRCEAGWYWMARSVPSEIILWAPYRTGLISGCIHGCPALAAKIKHVYLIFVSVAPGWKNARSCRQTSVKPPELSSYAVWRLGPSSSKVSLRSVSPNTPPSELAPLAPVFICLLACLLVVVRRYRRRRCTVESGRSVVNTHMASKSKVWFADTAAYLALGNGWGCTGTLVLVSTVTTIRCSLIYGLQ